MKTKIRKHYNTTKYIIKYIKPCKQLNVINVHWIFSACCTIHHAIFQSKSINIKKLWHSGFKTTSSFKCYVLKMQPAGSCCHVKFLLRGKVVHLLSIPAGRRTLISLVPSRLKMFMWKHLLYFITQCSTVRTSF